MCCGTTWRQPTTTAGRVPKPFLREITHDDELRICSQCGQDGILRRIFDRIGFTATPVKGGAAGEGSEQDGAASASAGDGKEKTAAKEPPKTERESYIGSLQQIQDQRRLSPSVEGAENFTYTPPFFVEFGARKPHMLNSAWLRQHCGWRGLIMDFQPGGTKHGGCGQGCVGQDLVRGPRRWFNSSERDQ